MSEDGRVREWLERGSQVGLTLEYQLSGKSCWSSVAIQKWQGKYKTYVDEIFEENMAAEEYEREDVRSFDSIEEAAAFIASDTRARFEDLRPCKGQRIFNPEFD